MKKNAKKQIWTFEREENKKTNTDDEEEEEQFFLEKKKELGRKIGPKSLETSGNGLFEKEKLSANKTRKG